MEDFTVLRVTFGVKPIEQLLDKGILVERYPNLPVLESLSLRLFGEVLICDDIVFELRYCTSLTFQEADFFEEFTYSGRRNNVKDVLFFTQSIQSEFKLLICLLFTPVAAALFHAPLQAAETIVSDDSKENFTQKAYFEAPSFLNSFAHLVNGFSH